VHLTELTLRWSRVDLARHRVHVAETLVDINGHQTFGPPKTAAAISLGPHPSKCLRRTAIDGARGSPPGRPRLSVTRRLRGSSRAFPSTDLASCRQRCRTVAAQNSRSSPHGGLALDRRGDPSQAGRRRRGPHLGVGRARSLRPPFTRTKTTASSRPSNGRLQQISA
jgi:hypothetical protein